MNRSKDETDPKNENITGELVPSPAFATLHLPSFQKVLNARRSIRVYTGEPIPEPVMREILNEAILAPSSSNLQSYELYWVKDPAKKASLAAACMGQRAATTASELIVVVARTDLWKTNLEKLLTKMTADGKPLAPAMHQYYRKLLPTVMRNDPFGLSNLFRRILFFTIGLRKPIVRAPVSRADHRVYGHIQAALAAQTLMLSLAAHGYDSCPMGGFDEVRVKDILNLPRKAEVTMVVSAGRRTAEGLYGPRIRLDTKDLVHEV